MSWDPAPEEDNPGILITYEINYKAVGSENWLTEQVWNTEEPYVITELEAFTSYTVSVTMVNLEGKGIAASVNVSTEEGGEPVSHQISRTWAWIPFGGKLYHFEYRQQYHFFSFFFFSFSFLIPVPVTFYILLVLLSSFFRMPMCFLIQRRVPVAFKK